MEEREEAREKKTRGPEKTPTRFVDIQVERLKNILDGRSGCEGRGRETGLLIETTRPSNKYGTNGKNSFYLFLPFPARSL